MIGFGTYQIANEDCEQPVLWALEAGYRHIDTAEFYANHEAIGKAIKASGIPRESIFITDKVSPDGFFGMPPRTYDGIMNGIKSNNDKLGCGYIDLMLLHHPFPPAEDRVNQYRALVEAQKQGLVKEIGVSNYSQKHIEELLAAGLPAPVINQVELHPLNTLAKTGLIEYMRSIGCTAMAYSSLAPASNWRSEQPDSSTKTEEKHSGHMEVLKAMTQKYGVSEGALLLRWALEHDYPIVPKSCNKDRIEQNLTAPLAFDMSKEDVSSLDALDQQTVFAWPVGDPMQAP
jgi:2,5-diketo-D-gluconate reductase A